MPKCKSPVWTRLRGKSWYYIFETSKHPRKLTSKGGFATEQEALDAGVIAYADWKSGNIGLTSERIKVKDYLESWLENAARPNVKRSTYSTYRFTVYARVIPHLGRHILQDLRPRDVDLLFQALAAAGMSHGTISLTKTVLSVALKYAVYPGELIKTNPVTGLSIPRSAPKKKVKRSVITAEQFAAIPTTARYYPALKIMYHTGMRISEVLGLTWDDIDFTTGRIRIERQRMPRGYFDTPKTESSARTIYVDVVLLTYLRALRATHAKDEMQRGEAYQLAYEDISHNRELVLLPKRLSPLEGLVRRPLICIAQNGHPHRYSCIEPALQKLGLNAHSFRHTHATKLIEAGAKPVAVAARLGHADAAITQNLYAHSTEEMQQEVSHIFEQSVVK